MYPLPDRIRLHGEVVDQHTGLGIPGARVHITDSPEADRLPLVVVWTDESGGFFAELDPEYVSQICGSPDAPLLATVSDGWANFFDPTHANWTRGLQREPIRLEVDRRELMAVGGPYRVFGMVVDETGDPLPGVVVRAVHRHLDEDGLWEDDLGWTVADHQGRYELRYALDSIRPGAKRPNLRVRIFETADESEAALAETECRLGASLHTEADVCVAARHAHALTEYESLVSELTLRGSPAEENSLFALERLLDDLALEDPEHAASLQMGVDAEASALETGLPGALFYGLAAEGVVPTATELTRYRRGDLITALERALVSHRVPQEAFSNGISATIDELVGLLRQWHTTASDDVAEPSLFDLLHSTDLPPDVRLGFINAFVGRDESDAQFWSSLPERGFSPTDVSAIRLALELYELTNQDLPLTASLVRAHRAGRFNAVAELTTLDRATLVEAVGFHEGADETTLVQLSALLDRREPELALRRELMLDPEIPQLVKGLLDATKGQDLRELTLDDERRTEAASRFGNLSEEAAEEAFRDFESLQRVARITVAYPALKGLLEEGLDSAWSIATIPEERFCEAMAPRIGVEAAKDIHAEAGRRALAAQHAFVQMRQAVAPQPFVIDGGLERQRAEAETLLKQVANAQVLFGSQALCACKHCRSVLSPAAYYVDLMDLLDFGSTAKKKRRQYGGTQRPSAFTPRQGKNALEVLLARRPDLELIPLSCANTLTPLPYIDVVNEVLEGFVTNERGAHDTADAHPDELRAVPQHVNERAYQLLAAATYPMTLPFHRPLAVVRTYLGQLDIRRHDVLKVFLPEATRSDPRRMAEELGASPEELALVVAPNQQPWASYGFASANVGQRSWLEFLSDVPTLLELLGAPYDELVELLRTQFLNPAHAVTLSQIGTGCNIDTMQVAGASPEFYDRLARFMRLRHRLDWSIDDLDLGLSAFDAADIDPSVVAKLLVAKEIANKLSQPIQDTLTLWTKLPTRGENSLYARLFLTKTVEWTTGDSRAFRLAPLGNELSHPGTDIRPMASAIQAAMRITGEELQRVIDDLMRQGRKVAFNLATLSSIYGYTVLARGLGISIAEVTLLRALFDTDFRDSGNPERALDFISFVSLLKDTTFDVRRLNYLVRHQQDPPHVVGPAQTLISSTLSSVRQGLLEAVTETANSGAPTEKVLRQHLGRAIEKGLIAEALAVLDPDAPLDVAARRSFVARHFGEFIASPDEAVAHFLARPEGLTRDKLLERNFAYVLDRLLPWARDRRQRGAVAEVIGDAVGVSHAISRELLERYLPSEAAPAEQALSDFRWLQGGGLSATYYDDPGLSGNIVGKAMVVQPSVPTGAPSNGFGARFEGYLLPDRTGAHTFFIECDGRVKVLLSLGERELMRLESPIEMESESASPSIRRQTSNVVALEEWTLYRLTIEYGTTTPGHLAFRWSPNPTTNEPVPAHHLFPRGGAESFAPIRRTFERVFKAAMLISGFELNQRELAYFVEQAPRLDLGQLPLRRTEQPDAKLLRQWTILAQYVRLRRRLPKGDQNLIDVFETAEPSLAVSRLCKVTGWLESTVATLMSASGFALDIAALRPPTASEPWRLTWLADAADQVRRVGVSADKLFDWARKTPDADQAKAVVQGVKARYERKEWLEVAQRLNDRLRIAQRDALVSYLTPRMRDRGVYNRAQLFDYFLLDVEMAPCTATSRIRLAISSVQLFIQRVLLNLEAEVTPAVVDAGEWQWLKNYRMWEANRKVFLYPENWVEPELRDDRSPLFEQLTQDLLRAELTKPVVERAYLAYLERLDDIARLDVRGLWHEYDDGVVAGKHRRDATDIYHVFGRSYAQPYRYYYRRFVDNTYWTSWTPVEVDILGDHVVPAMVGGRLMVFWLVLEEKSRPPTNFDVPKDGKGRVPPPLMDWDIRLESTEYRDGKWMQKSLSRDSLRVPQWWGMTFAASLRHITPGGDLFIDVHVQRQAGPQSAQVLRIGTFVKEGCRGEVLGISEAIAQSTLPQIRQRHGNATLTLQHQLTGPAGSESRLRHPDGAHIDATGFSGSSRPTVTTRTISQRRRQGNRNVTSTTQQRVVGPAPTLTLRTDANGGRPQQLLGRLDGDPKRPNRNYRVQFSLSPDSTTGARPMPFFFRDATNTYFVRVKTRRQRRTRIIFFRGDQHGAGHWRVRFQSRGLVQRRTPGTASAARGPKQSHAAAMVDIEANRPAMTGARSRKRRVTTSTAMPTTQRLVPRQVQVTEIEAKYQFSTFQHSFVCEFIRTLKTGGLDRLIDLAAQSATAEPVVNGRRLNYFQQIYQPGSDVWPNYPRNDVDFEYGGAYSNYNWELFFHIPLLVATRLAKEHKHEEAQRWFHYIFDPTTSDTAPVPARFWQFLPFRQNGELTRTTELMELLAYSGNDVRQQARQTAVVGQLEQWAKKPFNPHAIARLRMVAYQKATVMRYIDNLLEWGDQLFRKDTSESVNEATQLYLLAANILGRREKPMEPVVDHQPLTFRQMRENLEIFSNFVVQLETNHIKAPFSLRAPITPNDGTRGLLGLGSLYFCIPGNDKLDGYWDLVADRLFKVRHCMNIQGVVRQLPLFQPPIDPALLVRAAAAGVDLSAAIDGLTVPVPQRRFRKLLDDARRATAGLRALGERLLKAQEQQADRQMTHIELADQLVVMQRILDERKQGIAEARAEREALQEGLAQVEQQIAYFSALVDSPQLENEFQAAEQRAREEAIRNTAIAQGTQLVGKVLRAIPNFKVGVVAIGPESTIQTGGEALCDIAMAAAEGALAVAAASQQSAEMAAVNAKRHQVKAELKAKVAQLTETKQQFEKQIVAATVREAIAAGRYDLVQSDLGRLKEKDEWLRKQFTSAELYGWLSSESSSLLFRAYKVALDLAKSTERAYEFETGVSNVGIIQSSHFDAARKGLLCGERLQLDLDRLEAEWRRNSNRDLQLTKRISLRREYPAAFVRLVATGSCVVEIQESAFDGDYPGHYFRRLHSASVTLRIPHRGDQDAHCTLTLLKNRTRTVPMSRGQYLEQGTDKDPRFSFTLIPVEQVVTSHAIDDAGQFQLDLKDDSYFPFEGAGAISTWRIELPQRSNDFDVAALEDLQLTLRYTARDGGEALALAANQALDKKWKGQGSELLVRSLDLALDFPAEWAKLRQNSTGPAIVLDLDLGEDRFSPRYRDRAITVESIDVFLYSRLAEDVAIPLSIKPPKGTVTNISQWNRVGAAAGWRRGRLQVNSKLGPWQLRLGPLENVASELRRALLLVSFKA